MYDTDFLTSHNNTASRDTNKASHEWHVFDYLDIKREIEPLVRMGTSSAKLIKFLSCTHTGGQSSNIRARFEKMANQEQEVSAYICVVHVYSAISIVSHCNSCIHRPTN